MLPDGPPRGLAGRWARSVTALLLLLPVWGAASCAVQDTEESCDRLRRFSCGCFPECREEAAAAIEAQDSQRCEEAILGAFEKWRTSCRGNDAGPGSCGQQCEFGWSACAFQVYREVGLSPGAECKGPGGGAADAAAKD